MRTGMVLRGRRAAVATATALVAAGTMATPAVASIDPDAPVRANRNVTVFHQIDMVATFGHAFDQRLQVEVFRGTHRIAHTAAWAIRTDGEGGALEVNHGIEEGATPGEGDCWEQVTPDIRPFDRIVVTDANGGKDAILVDDLRVTAGPINAPDGVAFTGIARSALTLQPILPTALEGESRLTSRFRAETTDFVADPAVDAGFRGRYPAPGFGVTDNENLVDPRSTLMNPAAEHAIGFGHAPIVIDEEAGIERMQRDTQLFDVGAEHGPGVGCELIAPAAGTDAATALDDDMVTGSSGALVVSGTAASDVTRVDVTVSDGSRERTVTTDRIEAAPHAAGDAPRAWTATIAREDLDALAEQATLTITPAFLTAGDETREATGRPLTIVRDLQAPAPPTATPGAGELDGPRTVRLNAEARARIHFTLDGSAPDESSERYTLPLTVSPPATIRAIAVDEAGNVSAPATLAFTRRAPAAAPPAAQPPAAAPAPVVLVPGLGPGPASALRVAGVTVRSTRLSLRRARREGVVARFTAPRGAQYAEARLLRVGARGARTLVSRRLVAAAPGRAQLARFTGASVRGRLSRGRYVLEVRAGEAPTRLGLAATTTVRVV